jgi:hypothetical protein
MSSHVFLRIKVGRSRLTIPKDRILRQRALQSHYAPWIACPAAVRVPLSPGAKPNKPAIDGR